MANATWGLQHPTNMTEIKSLNGICNVLRRFAPNFIRIAALLSGKPEAGKGQAFLSGALNETKTDAPEMLQHWLLSFLMFTIPGPNGCYSFDTDACDSSGLSICRSNPTD